MDSNVGEAIRACIDMLQRDANEFKGIDGFSVKRIGGLFRRGIRVYRVKYERCIPGLRILRKTVCSLPAFTHGQRSAREWTTTFSEIRSYELKGIGR
jgi:hypothetical protein